MKRLIIALVVDEQVRLAAPALAATATPPWRGDIIKNNEIGCNSPL